MRPTCRTPPPSPPPPGTPRRRFRSRHVCRSPSRQSGIDGAWSAGASSRPMAAPINDLTSLDGKRILVTGAAQGLGEAIAGRSVDLGGSALIGDVQDDAGEAVADKLGDRASYHHLDVTSEADWQAFVSAADDRLGGLDGLVNNAAILYLGAL